MNQKMSDSESMVNPRAEFESHPWVNKFLAYKNFDDVEHVIAEVEMHTSAEIVPVIAQRSSSISHVPFCLFLIFVLLSVTLAPWAAGVSGAEVWLFELLGILLSWGLSQWLGKWPSLQRALLSISTIDRSVAERAELEFYKSNIKSTKDSTGVLIFISLLERRVVVLADEAIAQRLPNDTWSKAVSVLVTEIKNQQLASGLEKVIRLIGETLGPLFPPSLMNPNELSNRLILRD